MPGAPDQGYDSNSLEAGIHRAPLGPPAIHHSDQGIQYAAQEYVDLLRCHDVQISMADKGEAWQNGYAERLISLLNRRHNSLYHHGDR
jgi:putative transposase